MVCYKRYVSHGAVQGWGRVQIDYRRFPDRESKLVSRVIISKLERAGQPCQGGLSISKPLRSMHEVCMTGYRVIRDWPESPSLQEGVLQSDQFYRILYTDSSVGDALWRISSL